MSQDDRYGRCYSQPMERLARLCRRSMVFGKLCAGILFLIWTGVQEASAQRLVGDLPVVPVQEISQGMVAFANFASVPGLNSSNLEVRPADEPRFDLSRANLGFQTDVTLPRITTNGFFGAMLSRSSVDQNFELANELGDAVRFETDRAVLSGRVSAGLSFPINRELRVRTYLSAIVSKVESDTAIAGEFDPDPLDPGLLLILSDTEVNFTTAAATMQVLYDRWFGQHHLEIDGTYTSAFSDSFNESDDRLKSSGWSETVVFLARLSAPTGWTVNERPWRWNLYASHTNLLDQPRRALGFKYYHEIGAGLDYEWNLKPLNVFGLRYVGLRGGVIFGDDLDGWTLGIAFR